MTHQPDPTDPARMLELIRAQRRRTQSRLMGGYTLLLVVWATAWFVGFGALWLGQDTGGVPLIPAGAAWIVFGGCIVGGIVCSIVVGVRSGASGIRGRSQFQGALYGWSWTLSMVGLGGLLGGLQRAGIPPEVAALLYPGAFVLMVGVLYLAGGTTWRSPVQYLLGVVLIAVAVTATLIGAPAHYLVYAVVAPVAMLTVAVLMRRGVVPLEPRTREDAP